jgi:hypothetical protein
VRRLPSLLSPLPARMVARKLGILASLIETCKMNGVDPQAFAPDLLTNIVARHPISSIDELLPYAYVHTCSSGERCGLKRLPIPVLITYLRAWQR